MTKELETKPRGKSRLRSEIVEAMRDLHKVGAVSDGELEKTTLRMLGKAILPDYIKATVGFKIFGSALH